jgi:hypothetical protein
MPFKDGVIVKPIPLRRTTTTAAVVTMVLCACAGTEPASSPERGDAAPSSTSPVSSLARSSVEVTTSALVDSAMTPPRSSTTSADSTTLAAPTATAAEAVDQLPLVPAYEYRSSSRAENDAFLATVPSELSTNVESFTGADVRRGSDLVGALEVYVLRPQLRDMPGLDNLVLDTLSGYVFAGGPQTTERLILGGEEVLVRRVPRLVVWTWVEDGVVYSVVANGIDPGRAGDFVTALSAIQQGAPIPTPTSTPT